MVIDRSYTKRSVPRPVGGGWAEAGVRERVQPDVAGRGKRGRPWIKPIGALGGLHLARLVDGDPARIEGEVEDRGEHEADDKR